LWSYDNQNRAQKGQPRRAAGRAIVEDWEKSRRRQAPLAKSAASYPVDARAGDRGGCSHGGHADIVREQIDGATGRQERVVPTVTAIGD